MRATPGKLGSTLIAADAIRRRVGQLAAEIEAHYTACERPLVVLCVLKGAVLFSADLVRSLTIPVEMEFISMRSYRRGTNASQAVELVKDVGTTLADRDVLLVEDIVDTGNTTASLFRHAEAMRPRSLRLVTLLDKTSRRERAVTVHWRGFEIPDHFVVGYGLDFEEQYRNLLDVRILVDA